MFERKKNRRKFRNHRNDHNYLSVRQAAVAVEESMVNDKNNYLQQRYVEAKEAATRNQTYKVFSIIRGITGKSITNSAIKVNKRNIDPPVNRDELEEWGKYFEELLNNSSDLIYTSNIPEAPQDLNISISNR